MSKFRGLLNPQPSYQYLIPFSARNIKIVYEFTIDDIKNDPDKIKPNFIVKANGKKAAISTWVTPKRTRSKPFSRVYRTLFQEDMKKITIIPVVKDEGFDGDRDYLQFDTISMMTYLGVYVIPAYYVDAEKNMRPKQVHKEKITNQKFDSDFITSNIQKILDTSDDVQTWNKKIRNSIPNLVPIITTSYQTISNTTGVTLSDFEVLFKRLQKFNPDTYKDLSRNASAGAATAESKTTSTREKTFGFPKATITFSIPKIDGSCNLTTDGFYQFEKTLFLLECKHGKKSVPTVADVEDALFKYHFFNEFKELSDENFLDMDEMGIREVPSGLVRLFRNPVKKYWHSDKTRTVIVASSKGKTTKEISDKLKDISDECKNNSIIFIPIGKDDFKRGNLVIIEKLESIKN